VNDLAFWRFIIGLILELGECLVKKDKNGENTS
jgi:hypothetical protein